MTDQPTNDDPLVMYVVVRKDLSKTLKWPTGSIIAQGCHASVAALSLFYTHQDTREYISNLDTMHKVVLAANSEEELLEQSKILERNNIDHKVWVELPEIVNSALATRPYRRSQIKALFSALKLFR
ncbi:peptidyl-tRNA hydrolase [Acrasis kona]|uniref:peptidyl-tRNA hydrolase n=1 Tax=Acrasis kona TaxID=1008807 RepID=A0AAW2Z3K4_9EUKA